MLFSYVSDTKKLSQDDSSKQQVCLLEQLQLHCLGNQNIQFQRVIDLFLETSLACPKVHLGHAPTSQQSIQEVKEFFVRNPKAHIRQAVEELDMSFGCVWTILGTPAKQTKELQPNKQELEGTIQHHLTKDA